MRSLPTDLVEANTMDTTRAFRFLAACLVLLMLASQTPAATTEKWAVLCLVGDSLMVVRERAGTGSNLDPNARDRVAIDDDSVDRIVLRAMTGALTVPVAPELLALRVRDARLYRLQGRLLTSDEGAPLAQALVKAAADAGATHLLVIARNSGEFRIELSNGSVGVGAVDGLGFYVNRRTSLKNVDSGHTAVGYLAPFGMLRLMLVDIGAQRIVHDQLLKMTSIVPVVGSNADDPWDVLDAADKVRELEKMLVRESVDPLARMVQRKSR